MLTRGSGRGGEGAATSLPPVPMVPKDSSDRLERCRVFGLDCGEGFVWDGSEWAPGGEYLRRLRVTNVSTNTIHFTYRVPRAKVFFMDFPSNIVLSAGNHVWLEVSFRPIARVAYDDQLEVVTPTGSFFVPVIARLPQLQCTVPDALDFGAVPVNEVTSLALPVRNTGQVEAEYVAFAPPPFTVHPTAGTVAPGATASLTVSIRPTMAAVMRSAVSVTLNGGGMVLSTPLTALPKYQFIATDTPAIDFGGLVYAGAGMLPVTAPLVVRNGGPVRATLTVASTDAGLAHQVTIKPDTALVPAGGAATFAVSYLPHAAGARACEHFAISTPGGNTVPITVRGHATGPHVTLARKEKAGTPRSKRPQSVAFGDLKVGETASLVVVLTNHSRLPAGYEFVGDLDGVFVVVDKAGTVPPRLSKQVMVTFTPRAAGNYYRRIACLVRHGDPVWMDVLGTAYDDKKRPYPMRQRHVDNYRLRTPEVALWPPERVLAAVKASGVNAVTTAEQRAREAEWSLTTVRTRSGDRSRSGNAVYHDLFTRLADGHDTPLPVVLSHQFLDFGGVSRVRLAEKQTVTLYNRTQTKMVAQWVVPPSAVAGGGGVGGGGGKVAPVMGEEAGGEGGGGGVSSLVGSYPGFMPTVVRDWAVVPECAEIEPGGSVEFKVAFRPTADSVYYCQDMEVHVAPKVNRSFRLVDEESFTPPVTATLRLMGHTFRDIATFLPKLSTSFGGTAPEQTLVLPPCACGEDVYYTVAITNDSDVPAAFALPMEVGGGVLHVWPRVGVVPLRGSTLITLRFRPRHARVYALPLDVRINGSMVAGFRITVIGTGATPRLTLPEGLVTYLRPTGVGTFTRRTFTVRNATRLPLSYRWLLPSGDGSSVVTIHPEEGDVEGNDSASITVTVAPVHPGAIQADLRCDAHYIRGSDMDATVLSAALAPAPPASSGGGEPPTTPGRQHGDAAASTADAAGAWPVGDEAVQRMRLTVATEGLVGAVHFSQPHVEAGAVALGTSRTLLLTLANRSDGTLPFCMDAIIQVQVSDVDPDADTLRRALHSSDGEVGDAALMRDVAYAAALGDKRLPPWPQRHVYTLALSTRTPSSPGRGESTGGRAAGGVVSFEPATGTLPPRSHKQVLMTLSPTLAAVHRVRVYATLWNGQEGVVAAGTDHSRTAAISAAVAAELDTADPAFVPPQAVPANADDLWCDVAFTAACPTAHVEDVRQLTSREALLCLFPAHLAAWHNAFHPAALEDRAGAPAAMARTPVPEVDDTVFAGSVGGGDTPSPIPSPTQPAAPPVPPSSALTAYDPGRPTRTVAKAPAAPRDLWLRGDRYAQPALDCHPGAAAVCAPVVAGWGGWAFQLPSSGDAPVDGSSPCWTLWQQFSLAALNQVWASRPTADEMRHAATSGSGRLAATHALHQVTWEFKPAPAGSPPAVVVLQLRNGGAVPSILDFVLDHELEVDAEAVEPWVEVPDPDATASRLVEVMQRRVMDVQPRSLRLAPGEAGLIRVHYSYPNTKEAAGSGMVTVHEVPFVAQFRGGKAVHITMRGVTLPNTPCPYLWHPRPNHCWPLASVAIGSREPPVQRVPLCNPTHLPVSFHATHDSLAAMNALHHGFRVFHLDNPSGVVPPHSTTWLRVTFIPLEAKEYEARVVIQYSGAAGVVDGGEGSASSPADSSGTLHLCLKGWGYAPRLPNSPHPPLALLPHPLHAAVGLLPPGMPGLWGHGAALEGLALSRYTLAGLDTLTASVSTFFNPQDVLTALTSPSSGGSGEVPLSSRHMVLDAGTTDTLAAILFSGKDAAASATALGQYLHAVDLLHDLGEGKAAVGGGDGCSSPHALPPRKSRPSTVRPSAIVEAGVDHPAGVKQGGDTFLALAERLWRGGHFPRILRPDAQPPLYLGAYPPLTRHVPVLHHDWPEGMATLSSEWVDGGDMPSGHVMHRVLVLRNTRQHAPAQGVTFAWDESHPLITSGVVRIHPMCGEVGAGGAVLVRFTFTSPATATVIADDIGVAIGVPAAEYEERCGAALTAMVRQRDGWRRVHATAKPGADKPHISVTARTTVSRSIWLAQTIQASTAGKGAPRQAGTMTFRGWGGKEEEGEGAESPDRRPRPATGAAATATYTARGSGGVLSATGQAIAGSARVSGVGAASKPRAPGYAGAAVDSVDGRDMLVALLTGDMSVDESRLLVAGPGATGGSGVGGGGGGGVSAATALDAIPLPPPPTCRLHVHVTLRAMPPAEFVAEYSPAHLAAFQPACKGGQGLVSIPLAPAAGAAGHAPEREEGGGLAARDGAPSLPAPVRAMAQDVLCALLAEIVQEADPLATAVAVPASTGAAAPQIIPKEGPAATSWVQAGPGATFASLAAAPTSTPQSALLSLALAAGGSSFTPSHAASTVWYDRAASMGHPVYHAGLPPPRPQDATFLHHPSAAVAMAQDEQCRDFAARMVEGIIFLLMKAALEEGVQDEAPRVDGADGSSLGGGPGPAVSFIDTLPPDLDGLAGDEWMGLVQEGGLEERLARVEPRYSATAGEDE